MFNQITWNGHMSAALYLVSFVYLFRKDKTATEHVLKSIRVWKKSSKQVHYMCTITYYKLFQRKL